jgi:hypothetical protein
MIFGKRNRSRFRSWYILVLAACIWCGVCWFAINAGWQAVAILVVISALLRWAWAAAVGWRIVVGSRRARRSVLAHP